MTLYAVLDRIGDTDCETIRDSWLAQPANAVSSGAYVLVGVWFVVRAVRMRGPERATQVAFGAILASVGVGSFLFHGPMPPGARFIHDFTIAALVALILARSVGLLLSWSESVRNTAFVILSVSLGLVLVVSADAVLVVVPVLGGAALVFAIAANHHVARREMARLYPRWLATSLGMLVIAGIVNLLGRTGGPWCEPDSLLQGHAVWHVLSAAALWLYGIVTFSGQAAAGNGVAPPG